MADNVFIKAQRVSANDRELKLLEWTKQPKARVKKGDVVGSAETSKIAFDLESPADGFFFPLLEEGDVVDVDKPLAVVAKTADFSHRDLETDSQSPSKKFTKKATKLIRDSGLSEELFSGLERVTEADVHDQLNKTAGECEFLEVSFAKLSEIRTLRQAAAETIPGFVSRQFNYSNVMSSIKTAEKKLGSPLSLASCALHSAARLLSEDHYFWLNGYIESEKFKHYRQVNIGYAFNIDTVGLRVGVVKKPIDLGVTATAARISELSLKYMRGEMDRSDVTGATFTITDLSSAGVNLFIPNLVPRQSAMLGICAPDGNREYVNFCLAFDHQCLDGNLAAAFLKDLEAELENFQNVV